MSTNSNENDDLMEDNRQKQTKIQKFLKTIDDETMRKIQSYLRDNQPSSNANTKSDKIKLYHDLMIIYYFKLNQKQIRKKNKMEQICQSLRQQTNFSVNTLKQRIQKKLSNVRKQTLLDHIKLGIDLAFDTKRKLMPIKSISKFQNKYEIDNNDIDLEQGQSKQESSIQKHGNPIEIKSSGSESPYSVQQIRPVKYEHQAKKQITKKFIKKPIPQQPGKQKIERSFKKINLYNQFREMSDHESDDQVLIIKQDDIYRISSHKSQASNKLLLQKVSEAFHLLKQKQNNQDGEIYQDNQQIEKGNENVRLEENSIGYKQEREQMVGQQNVNLNIASGKQQVFAAKQKEINKQNNDNKFINIEQSDKAEQQQNISKQQLYMFCSIDDWKLAKYDKKFEHLRWESMEDDFLRQIANNQNKEQVLTKLQILKRYKQPQNILSRLKFLNISPPQFMIGHLAR